MTSWNQSSKRIFKPSSSPRQVTADELRATIPGIEMLPDKAVRTLAQIAIPRRFAKGGTLYRAGDPANGLYILLSGQVRVSRDASTRRQTLHSESTGGVLGEIPVFGGGSFPATAVATEPTRCAYIPMGAIERLLRDEPAFARFALRRMALRARSLLRRIDDLSATTIIARAAAHVLVRAERAREKEFTLGMTQDALAADLGTAREVVVRSLRMLIAAGAIERVGRSRFRVASLEVLMTMAAT